MLTVRASGRFARRISSAAPRCLALISQPPTGRLTYCVQVIIASGHNESFINQPLPLHIKKIIQIIFHDVFFHIFLTDDCVFNGFATAYIK